MTRRSSRLDGARWDKPDTAAKKIQVFPPAVYARVDRYPYLVRRLSYPLAIHVAVALEEPEPELDLDDEEQLQAYEAAYFHQRQIDAEMRKPPGERNFGTSTAYTESDDGSEGVRRSLEWRKRVAEDFLRQRGWRIVHAGSTGNDRGRPSKGSKEAARIGALIEPHLDGYALEELIPLRPGRQTPEQARRRVALAVIVAKIGRQANPASLSEFLSCSRSTVYALRRLGFAQLAQKSPKSEVKSSCWVFEDWVTTDIRVHRGSLTPFFRPASLTQQKESLSVLRRSGASRCRDERVGYELPKTRAA